MAIHLIPYRRLSFNTHLSVDQAVALLQESVEPAPPIYFGWGQKTSKPFEGTVTSTGFTISRVIRYRNSFLPFLNGRFTRTLTGTEITVRMSIHPLIMLIVALALITFGPPLISALITRFDLALALILPSVYILITAAFNFEAKRAETLLMQILEPYTAYVS